MLISSLPRLLPLHAVLCRPHRPHNSLVHQSYGADFLPGLEQSPFYKSEEVKARNHFVNADGLGTNLVLLVAC